MVARFLSLDEKGIPRNGTASLERLEISAHLDVIRAGKYRIRARLSGAPGVHLPVEGSAELGVGIQTLTASIPSAEVRQLDGGPWTIGIPRDLPIRGKYLRRLRPCRQVHPNDGAL